MATNKRLIRSNDEGGGVAASFNTVVYSGTNATIDINNVGFQPDLIWTKCRTNTYSNMIVDSVRGGEVNLRSNTNGLEEGLAKTTFDAEGYNLIWDGPANSSSFQGIGENYVAWCWKAGGAAVATGNTNLSNSFASANPEAGFSIMTYTGSGTDGTINHGLNQAPEFWIYKNRTNPKDWFTCTTVIDGSTKYGFLNSPGAFGAGAAQYTTNTLIGVNADGGTQLVNGASNNYVLYAFHSVAGYQKVGSYQGSTSAVPVTTGFQPRFVLVKGTTEPSNWTLWDNIRGGSVFLQPNNDGTEASGRTLVFNPDGFTVNTDAGVNGNNDGQTYIYLAIA